MESIYEEGAIVDNLKKALASIFQFYNDYDPMFTWQAPKPYKRLDEALTVYGAEFKAKTKSFYATDKSSVY